MKKFVAESNITLNFTAYDDSRAVINLTGASIQFVIKQNADDASALVSKTVGSGVTVVSASDGTFKVELEPNDTTDFSGAYVAEIKLTDSSSNVSFLAQEKGDLIRLQFRDNIVN